MKHVFYMKRMNTRNGKSGPSITPTTVTLLALLFITLKIPSLLAAHVETDELIYASLTRNLFLHGQYNLVGLPIYETLSPAIYHHPLFHHPPLLPLLMVLFMWLGIAKWAIVISWIGHFLCIASVAIQCRLISSVYAGDDRDRYAPWVSWLPVLAICVDPVLYLISRKIWMDDLMAGLISLSATFGFLAQRSPRAMHYSVAARLPLGAASLFKVIALAFLPFLVWILYQSGNRGRLAKWRLSGTAMLVCAVLVLPWFIVFWNTFHALLPWWVFPDDQLIRSNPFIQATVSKPWYYYLKMLPLACPLVLLGGWGLTQLSARGNRIVAVNAAFCAGYILLMTITSASSAGFQMRFLAPAIPGVYVLFGACLLRIPRWRHNLLLIGVLCVVYASMQVVPYVLNQDIDDYFPLWTFVRITVIARGDGPQEAAKTQAAR